MFLPSCSGTVVLKELEMPPAHISAALLAIALWAAPTAATAAEKPAPPPIATEHQETATDQKQANQNNKILPANEDWRHSFATTVPRARTLVEGGYEQMPTLVVILSAFLVLARSCAYFLPRAFHRPPQGTHCGDSQPATA